MPSHLAKQQVAETTLKYFNLPFGKKIQKFYFSAYIDQLQNSNERIIIGLAGKYMGPRDTYASIHSALEHASATCGVQVEVLDIPSDIIEAAGTKENRLNSATENLSKLDGIIVPGGFGIRGWEGKIACITYARTTNTPLLAICYGFQAAIVEFAREC